MNLPNLKIAIAFVLGFLIFGIPLIVFDIEKSDFIREPGFILHLNFLEGQGLYWMHHLAAGVPVFFFGVVLNFYKYRQAFIRDYLKPMFFVSLIFLSWDVIFNHLGVWGFNESYYLGPKWLGLPVEEWLWFWVIPFCSLFIYEIVKGRVVLPAKMDMGLSWMILAIILVFYFFNLERIYTAWSLGASLFVVLVSIIWPRQGFAVFVLSFLLNLIPMYLFNGMLTGLLTTGALVMYNPMEFSNLRLGSFPMEDLGFGFAYLYGIVLLSKYIKD
ncbi:MAG: lycopene cyclase domain-containing protein [Saprospiraceae bacterium]|nr:lycopene cyclase domain-containing protein [Saprospiraceae bacterium]